MIQLKLTTEPNSTDQSTFEVAEDLYVTLTGANPSELYSFEISYASVPLFTCFFATNSSGNTDSIGFWTKLGMVDPDTGTLYSYPQAQIQWQGKQLDITVKDSTSVTVVTRSITISTSPVKPVILATNASGVILAPIEEESAPIYISVYNLPPVGYRVYMVNARLKWAVGDSFIPVSKANGGIVTKDITVLTGGSAIAEVIPATETLTGSYGFILRPISAGQLTEFVIKTADLKIATEVAVVTRKSANSVPRCCGYDVQLTGRKGQPDAKQFFYSDTFKKGEPIYIKLTPDKIPPTLKAQMCSIYIVPHYVGPTLRPDMSILNQIPGVEIKTIRVDELVSFGPIPLWENSDRTGEFDVVIDFGNNKEKSNEWEKDGLYNCGLDLLDGYYLPGFRITDEDPATFGEYENISMHSYGIATGSSKIINDYNSEFYDLGFTTGSGSLKIGGHIYFPYINVPPVTPPVTLKDIATTGTSHPLIVLMCGTNQNYELYEPLLQHFAKNGFIAVTIYMNLENTQRTLARAELIRYNLDAIYAEFAEAKVSGSIQNNVGLLGHSRGGEAVVLAKRLNLEQQWGYHINAVASLAPSDAHGYEYIGEAEQGPETKDWRCAYFVLYGSSDGEVTGAFSTATNMENKPFRNSGYALYDKSYGIRKSMLFVYGATHNRFHYPRTDTESQNIDSDVLGFDLFNWNNTIDINNGVQNTGGNSNRTLAQPATAHHTLAEAYFNAFFRVFLKNDPRFWGVMKGEWFPPSVEVVKTTQEGKMQTYIQYEDHFQSSNYAAIDFFEIPYTERPEPPTPPEFAAYLPPSGGWAVSTDPYGAPIIGGTVTSGVGSGNIAENYAARRPIPTLSSGLDKYSPHCTGALKVKWTARGQFVTFNFPQRDVRGFAVLSFRIAQCHESESNVANTEQSFSVTLKDTLGNTGNVFLAPFGNVPYPFIRTDDGGIHIKSGMRTIRIPLHSFKCPGVTIDLSKINALSFYFSETQKGEILLDSIEFARDGVV